MSPWPSKSHRRPAISSGKGRGTAPKAVTAILSEDTLVITLHGALSAAEEDLAKSPAGAASSGFPPAAFRKRLRTTARGDQEDHRRSRTRGGRGSRDKHGHRDSSLYHGGHGAGIFTCSRPDIGCMERENPQHFLVRRRNWPSRFRIRDNRKAVLTRRWQAGWLLKGFFSCHVYAVSRCC